MSRFYLADIRLFSLHVVYVELDHTKTIVTDFVPENYRSLGRKPNINCLQMYGDHLAFGSVNNPARNRILKPVLKL